MIPDLGIAVHAGTRRACRAIERLQSISAQFSASKSVEVRPLGSLIRAFSGCSKAAARGADVLRNAGVASCCVAGSVRHADFWLAGISSRPKGSGTSTAAIKTACWLQCSCHHGCTHRTALEAIFATLLCSNHEEVERIEDSSWHTFGRTCHRAIENRGLSSNFFESPGIAPKSSVARGSTTMYYYLLPLYYLI